MRIAWRPKIHIHWWRRISIRWRLAIGSMLVALFATTLLALIVIFSTTYYYGVYQRNQLVSVITESAQHIGESYGHTFMLARAAQSTFFNTLVQNIGGEDYVVVIFNRRNQPVYPTLTLKAKAAPLATLVQALADPSLRNDATDFAKIRSAEVAAQHGTATVDEIGKISPGVPPRPFAVQPIYVRGNSSESVVGVLVMIPRSAAENSVPPFIETVRSSVLVSSIIVALLAMLAALLFSRTITRPLARLTATARVLSSGDYTARVETNAGGELGELASAFNEMGERLKQDVDALREQELWRRELIMNITHDLATPLTAIAGLGESLIDGVNQSREDYEDTGRIIVRETLRLRRLVKDLHIMAKMEAGALQPQRTAVRLPWLVDEVLAVLTPEFERANVEPCNAIAYNLPLVQADADMLMRVFSNLCDNALRHTPSGGTVTIEAIPMQDGNLLQVSVTDSGEGIPAEALSRVFERFFRADSSRQTATGGSGLGLAIVRAIIEAHGGSVWAENAPAGGARILFTLPLGGVDQAAIADSPTLPLRLSALK